ncbi:MAG: YfcE family phosphodiesterase [Candidatus Hodarchaeota archaeon]
MKRVLIFGDAHIPSRRDSIPDSFHKTIEETDYDLALVTGDLVSENDMRAALPPLPECYIVQGNMDYGGTHDFHRIIPIDNLSILLIHGTQLRPRGSIKQLREIVDNVGADIAIHGHTHKPAIDLYSERLFLNPGTISGATGGWSGRLDASFMEADVSESKVEVRLHVTNWKVAKVSQMRFCKEDTVMKQC